MVSLGLSATSSVGSEISQRNFSEDVAFLQSHVRTIVLGDLSDRAQLAVVPAYQGRVMTSTASGRRGTSYGWINYEQVARGIDADAQINVFGGEERFWLGPEGGQFSLFFPPGAAFEFAHWQTPPLIDTDAFDVVDQGPTFITLQKEGTIGNYTGTQFNFKIDRKIEMLSATAVGESLGVEIGKIDFVGYRTTNCITNTGSSDWRHDTGLLSIWILGMYKPSTQTTVVIPFLKGEDEERGQIVNDAYFGDVPAERLKVLDGVIYFMADGRHRAKIGLAPRRATSLCGSYDATRDVLTIVKYNKPPADVTEYVNSMWQLQEKPYEGDVINAYNDGPPEPGVKPLGPFYELETSSPALALGRGESANHVQETYHFDGSRQELNHLSRQLLGVSLQEIQAALP